MSVIYIKNEFLNQLSVVGPESVWRESESQANFVPLVRRYIACSASSGRQLLTSFRALGAAAVQPTVTHHITWVPKQIHKYASSA